MDPRDTINSIIEWQQVQRDFANSLELLYAILLSVMTTDSQATRAVATDFHQRLAAMPEGWRIARFLWELDELWGCQLKCKGLALDDIMNTSK
jgi:hypothetical protein